MIAGRILRMLVAVATVAGIPAAIGQVATAFTYQGHLKFNGAQSDGSFDFRFILWDAEDGGNQVSAIVHATNVEVVDGLFTVSLDFGSSFEGAPRWLEVAVRPSGGTPHQLLSPRQPVTPAPYAITSALADSSNALTGRPVSGVAPLAGQLLRWDGAAWSPSDEVGTTYSAGAGLDLSGTTFSIASIGVSNAMLASGAVTDAKVTDVAWGKITGAPASFPPSGAAGGNLAGTYPNPQIAAGAVTSATLADGAVSTAKLGDLAVSSAKLGDSAVPASKLAVDGASLARVSNNLAFVSGANIGIGTASPADKLSVAGVVQSSSGGFRFPDGSLQTTASAAAAGGRTSQQIALLRWYEANQAQITFSVTGNPYYIAFDGECVWVPRNFNPSVMRVRISDGTVVGTYPAGTSPTGAAYDGVNVWITNWLAAGTVTRLRARDGAAQGTFAVGNAPGQIAFDGSNMWVTNYGSDNVTKLQASDGALVGTYAVGDGPEGIAFDGVKLWIANYFSGSVSRLRASDGANLGSVSVGNGPRGVAFDGTYVWVTTSPGLVKLRASDGANLGVIPLGTCPHGVAFDGSNIWVTDNCDDTVTKIRAADGVIVGVYVFPDSSGPWGIAFDGANMWIINAYSSTLRKL